VRHNDAVSSGSTGSEDRPSERVVEQRIRNRVIEYFEVAASFDAQQKYARDVPIAHVPYEVINQWEDWVWKDPRSDPDLPTVYAADEVEALRQYQSVWDVACRAVSDDFPSLDQVQALPEWEQLRQAAESALGVFARRGRMPEDHELP
jgi:hypothetical protein